MSGVRRTARRAAGGAEAASAIDEMRCSRARQTLPAKVAKFLSSFVLDPVAQLVEQRTFNP